MDLQMVWNKGSNSTLSNPVLPEEVISLDDYLAIIDVIIHVSLKVRIVMGLVEEETAWESLRISILGIRLQMLRCAIVMDELSVGSRSRMSRKVFSDS